MRRGWGSSALGLLAVAAWSAAPVRAANFPVAGFSEEEFRQIGEQGFGDRGNSYAWGMAFFQGKLYIGTNRHFLCMQRVDNSDEGPAPNPEIPRDCEPSLLDMDLRARIFTFDPATKAVELVHISPTFSAFLSDGTRVDAPRAVGYRTMTVFRERDGTEALYVGSFTEGSLPSVGAKLLRSTDGRRFEEVPINLPHAERFHSFRSLTVFNGRLFMLALSSDPGAPDVVESADPVSGNFRFVSEPGFGDPANAGAFEMAAFAGHLYVGTFGAGGGFQLLKTAAAGRPPYAFKKVLVDGAYRGIKNQTVLSLYPYKDHLYVGSGVYFGSLTLIPNFVPAPAELLRVRADDSWEIVCGQARNTPEGYKSPITGVGPGFGNPFTGYMWRMVEHDGVLYLGTFDTSVLAQYADDIDIETDMLVESVRGTPLEALLPPLIETLGPEEIADVISAVHGGFDLWRTTDGRVWQFVSYTGLGDQFNYGVRNLISTPHGLFVGSANPFFGFRLYQGQPTGTDSDHDSFPDGEDNCPLNWNLNQADLDENGVGDACDPDRDGDCLPDASDAHPRFAEPDALDTDGDGVLDRCDDDDDDDGVLDMQDNCPLADNPGQADADEDGIGDACGSSTSVRPLPGNGDVLDAPEGTEKNGSDAQQVFPRPCGAVGTLVGWGIPLGLMVVNPRLRAGRVKGARGKRGEAG